MNPITATEVQLTAGSQTLKGHSHLFEKVKHIYFFDQSGSENADGTYENPYSYADLTDIKWNSPKKYRLFQHIHNRRKPNRNRKSDAILKPKSRRKIRRGRRLQKPSDFGGSIRNANPKRKSNPCEAHPQKISGIKLYNAGFSTGIQTESTSNGATYIELSQMQLSS